MKSKLVLELIKGIIHTFCNQEFLMIAGLMDSALVQYYDFICMLDG